MSPLITPSKMKKQQTADIVSPQSPSWSRLESSGEFTFNLRDDKGQIIAASNDKDGKFVFTGLNLRQSRRLSLRVVTEVKGNDEDGFTTTWLQMSPLKLTQEIGDTTNALVSSVVYPKDTTLITASKNLKTLVSTSTCLKPFMVETPKTMNSPLTFFVDEKGQLCHSNKCMTVMSSSKTFTFKTSEALTPTQD